MPTFTGKTLLLLAFLAFAPAAMAVQPNVEAIRVDGIANGESVGTRFPWLTGEGVVIAVVGTGVDNEHEDFHGAWLTGVDVSSPCPPRPLAPADPDDVSCYAPTDSDDQAPSGTNVAAVALARPSRDGAYRGVAPGASLVEVKVGTDPFGSASTGALRRAFLWIEAHNLRHPLGDPAHVDVVLLAEQELGAATPGDPSTEAALRLARRGDALVVAPSSQCTSRVPPDCKAAEPASPLAPLILVAGGLDDRGTGSRADDLANHTGTRGLRPQIHAPSVNVTIASFSPVPGTATGHLTTTRWPLGAGHVAGVAALLMEDEPRLTPAQAREAILSSAHTLASGERELDAYRAILAARALANPPPVPSFAWSPERPVPGLAVTFDGSRSMAGETPARGHAWRFGEGEKQEGERVTWTFDAVGAYDVTLEVANARGDVSSLTRRVEVVPPVRQAVLNLSTPRPLVGEEVVVDFSASRGAGGIVRHEVDFGDGSVLACDASACSGAGNGTRGGWNAPAAHRYDAPGDRTVRLRLVDATGASFETAANLTVLPPAPQAVLEARPLQTRVGAPVRLDATRSLVPGGVAAAEWRMGDGREVVCPSEACPQPLLLEHRYASKGAYVVRLLLRDMHGRESVVTERVSVFADPPPEPTPTAPTQPAPTPHEPPSALRLERPAEGERVAQGPLAVEWRFPEGEEARPVRVRLDGRLVGVVEGTRLLLDPPGPGPHQVEVEADELLGATAAFVVEEPPAATPPPPAPRPPPDAAPPDAPALQAPSVLTPGPLPPPSQEVPGVLPPALLLLVAGLALLRRRR